MFPTFISPDSGSNPGWPMFIFPDGFSDAPSLVLAIIPRPAFYTVVIIN